jgi:uncharacterized protein
MIVVSDTSPLTALLSVSEADILPKLFGDVIIPEVVRDELLRYHASLPAWLRAKAVKDTAEAVRLAQTVDIGEAEAIALAKELQADLLLIDERKGRRLAVQEQLPVIGLLGVVLLAKRRALTRSARALLQRLECDAGIYISEHIRDQALKSVGE